MDFAGGRRVVCVAIAEPGEVRALLATAQTDKTDPERRYSVDAMIGAGQCWKVEEGGQITAAFVTTEDNGELWVSVAVGRSACDLVEILVQHLDATAAGRYRSIGFQTARRGLVKKTQHHGYAVAGYIMRKTL